MRKWLLALLVAVLFSSAAVMPAVARAPADVTPGGWTTDEDDPPKKSDKSKKDDEDKDDEAADKDKADKKDEAKKNEKKDDESDDGRSDKAKKETEAKKSDKKLEEASAKSKTTKSEAPKPTPIKKLLEVRLDQFLVPARAINIALPGRTQTGSELLDKFAKWSKDDEVGGILLNCDGLTFALPDVEELRTGVSEFRKSGKKVYAFMNSGDPMDYLLACEADEIAIAPTGSLAIPGIGRVFQFMRGFYQMQGIEYDVITAGRFKYPGFVNEREPNKYFREEFSEILDSWYGDYVKMIAARRGLTEAKVREAINIALFNAESAKNRGLIDTIAYYDEFRDRVARRNKYKKAGEGDTGLAGITSLQDLLTTISKQMKEAQESYKQVGPKIAILHARGPIVDMNIGAGVASMIIQRDEFVKSVEEIRKNKSIRAVVLHIDSPGGSGYASDVIWRKLRELDEEKPLVVSMGTVAGSGGYYIACPGRLIFAQPTTITGSIGVIGMIPNMASAINRADIALAEMKRGDRSLLGSGHRGMVPEDREFIQKYILDFYEVFLDRVAASRKMPKDQIRKLAEGRIYTGRQALEIGLVDRLGGLKDAIAAVREMADIPASAEIKLLHYPRPPSLGELAENLFGATALMQAAQAAQSPAPVVTFDSQVRYFARDIQPLCWMAVPDFVDASFAGAPNRPSVDLLKLSSDPFSIGAIGPAIAPLTIDGRPQPMP